MIDLSIADVKGSVENYEIGMNDRIIINGGEPTIHKDLILMLKMLCNTEAEIILYSNGRMFQNIDFTEEVICLVKRIVIPIHGDAKVHNEITQKRCAFEETIKGLKNIISLNQIGKLEIKFIVNQRMIDEQFSISSFLKEYGLYYSNIVITGAVETRISRLYNNIIPNEDDLGIYVSKQLEDLINGPSRIKLVDCKLCKLSHNIRHWIEELETQETDIMYEYFFIDSNIPAGKRIKYNSRRDCLKCQYVDFCRSVLDACIVLQLEKNKKMLVLE